ncbi:MAG: hypothetical protein ACOZIN_08540 [Myxococcota bacterium]
MKSRIRQADADGKILQAGGTGIGFCLLPAVEPGAGATVGPGSYPVRVRFKGEGEVLEISNGTPFVRHQPFRGFDVENCQQGDSWQIVTLESRCESIGAAAAKTRHARQVQAATAIPTAAAVNGDASGFRLYPGDRELQFYITGAGVDVDLYTQALSGVWHLAERLAEAADARPLVIARTVAGAIGRLYLRASAGGGLVEIDRESEVG